jgi:hypothetical protein
MYRQMIHAAALVIAGAASAHDMTPTYPKPSPSPSSGVTRFKMTLRNARQDIQYYALAVISKDGELMRFAATDRILAVPYGYSQDFDVYIRNDDLPHARYICTQSKIFSGQTSRPVISSTICSRIDGELP